MSTSTTTRTLGFDTPVTARPAARPAPAAGGLRLTRRGRLVVLGGLVALLLTAFALGRVDSQAATDAPAPTGYAATTVHQGETLWAVAKRVAPDTDPRALVQQIRELNDLDSASVQVGQQLLLPHGS